MIIRSHKDKNFTIFSNSVLQNPSLTWEARGMLGYLISLPEDWETHVTELSNRSPAGYAKNKRIITELERAGHIVKSQKRGEDGRFLDWVFDVYDKPEPVADSVVLPHSGCPEPASPVPGSPHIKRTLEEKPQIKKDQSNKEPVAFGDGNNPDAPASPERLSFESEFGFGWSSSWDRFLSEHRAMAIMKKSKVTGTDIARRIMAEWAASVSRNSGKGQLCDPAALLVSLCRRGADGQLGHTKDGDERMPKWA